jgi:fido (protein-threonine AMPylation protein)
MNDFEKEHPRDKNNQKFIDKDKLNGKGMVKKGSQKFGKTNIENKYKPDNIYDTKEYRKQNYKIAIGLQAVDNIKPSKYFYSKVDDVVEGKITYEKLENNLENYYSDKDLSNHKIKNEKEADIVNNRIAKLISISALSTLKTIHKQLFAGLGYNAGNFRDYNFSKQEIILPINQTTKEHDSVIYGDYNNIGKNLEQIINSFDKLNEIDDNKDFIGKLSLLSSMMWQVHPFSEGNTRTTAVFLIKYLRNLGFNINNEPFEKHSKYYRNAFVRNCYKKRIPPVKTTDRFLKLFYENLLFNKNHKLNTKDQFIY